MSNASLTQKYQEFKKYRSNFVQSLLDEGFPIRNIAFRFGVYPQRIYQWLGETPPTKGGENHVEETSH